ASGEAGDLARVLRLLAGGALGPGARGLDCCLDRGLSFGLFRRILGPPLRDVPQRLEAGALADEGEVDASGGAVSLLADDELRLAVHLRRVALIDLGAIDEEDDVRVLLDRSRFAEVGEHGALASAPGLHRAG